MKLMKLINEAFFISLKFVQHVYTCVTLLGALFQTRTKVACLHTTI